MPSGTTIILPENGRPRQIMDILATTAGKTVRDVVVEKDSISITCYTASLATSASLNVTIEQIGNSDGNVILIARLDTIVKAGADPEVRVFNVDGNLRITVEYTGAATFDMQGRAVSAAMVAARNIQDVSISLTDADTAHQEAQLIALHKIVDATEAILNHQRFITQLETAKGEKF